MKFFIIVLGVIVFIISSMFAFVHLKQENIKIGLLYSKSGTMSANELPIGIMLKAAVEDINKKGGIKKRNLEIVEFDGKSDPDEFKKGAKELVEKGVIAIFGCWTSASRKAVKDVVEKEDNLLFYPVQYEGFESSKNIIYLGLSANQQINPTIDFIQTHFGKNIYLVGSDYIYPKATNNYIKELSKLTELNVLGERYYKLGSRDFSDCIQEIKSKKPDAVINTINGDSNIAFFKELEKNGIDSHTVPVFSLSLDESMIQEISAQIGSGAMKGHYTTWGYFDILNKNRWNDFTKFLDKNMRNYQVSDAMFSTYAGVSLLKEALEASQEFSTKNLLKNIKGSSINISENIYYIDPKNNHMHRRVLIGQIDNSLNINIVWQSKNIILPKPYPEFKSKEFWDYMLNDIYAGYSNSWEAK